MADDFKSLVKEQKDTNKKLDQLIKAADPAGSAAAEDRKDQITADTKRTNLLRKMAGGITDLAKGWKDAAKAKLKGLSGGLVKFLKGVALAGLMVALLAFLESDTWKSMKKSIVEFIPKLKDWYKKTLKPFIDNMTTFLTDMTWENFKNIFAGVENPASLLFAIAGLALLFAPMSTMLVGGLLWKASKGFVKNTIG